MNCYKCATPVPDHARFCATCGTDVSGDSHGHGPTLAMEDDPQLFTKLQAELGTDFVLERELGRGGMAVVYLGRDAHLNRKVAVKVLPPELTYGGGGSMIERFKREAQTAAKLDHPNIIPVFRVSTGGTLFWYVMKYLDGEALNDILEREGQLPIERAVDIVTQVAGALDYAHQNQVVHRDVKPANVLVDKRGWCTVTDFGIAKALDANTLTASGSIIGTPYYMSPEQCKGKKVGPAADQYSLAVMTFQMLGGHVPFTGDSAIEIVHKHVADPVPPLGVLRPNLSNKVIQVVERGLAKNAEERFASVADFAVALKGAAQGLDVSVAPPGKVAPVRMSRTALVSPVPGALRSARGTWRERKGLVFGTLAGLAVVAGIAGALVLRPGEPKAPSREADLPSGLQFASGSTPVAQVPGRAAAVAVAPPPVAQPRGTATPARREPTPRPQQRVAAASPERLAAPVGRAMAIAPPAVQQPAASQPTAQPSPPAPAAMGKLTVTTFPASATIFINDRPMSRNPVVEFEVPAGNVSVRVSYTDSIGQSRSQTRQVPVPAGGPVTRVRFDLRQP